MLKPFLAYKSRLDTMPAGISLSLRWKEDSTPAIAIQTGAQIYLLCGSPSDDSILIFEANDPAELLAVSVNAFNPNTLQFNEWLRLCQICSENDIPFTQIAGKHIAPEYINLLNTALTWDDTLQNIKNLPMRTAMMIAAFTDSQRSYLASFINAERPSMQSLKLFIELVRDFSPSITATDYNKTEFQRITEKRSPRHIDADSLLRLLKYAKSPDNYETGNIQWTFTAKDISQYRAILQELEGNLENTEKLFKIISE